MSGLSRSVAATSRSLYRSLLRIANQMPDDHRRALVVFRARSEFDKSRSLTSLEEIKERQTEAEIYKDQLEFQAQHLQSLALSSNLLIPVDIRSPPSASPSSSSSSTSDSSSETRSSPSFTQPSRPTRPSRPSRPSHPSRSTPPTAELEPPNTLIRPTDRRKLLRAFQARKEGTVRGRSGRNRFMEGPEPSWIVKRRREEAAEGKGGENLREGREGHAILVQGLHSGKYLKIVPPQWKRKDKSDSIGGSSSTSLNSAHVEEETANYFESFRDLRPAARR
ncbi:LYR motif-containing protein [Sporobolomyces salmoneus]|uniref:LYR motif-containing protein n=1 Tax=Sporobolomyces salmoneus TaxID=183962 RepID=UPI00316BC580